MLEISKNNFVSKVCADVELPRMIKIRQKFDKTHIPAEGIDAAVRAELERDAIASRIKPGMSIGITSGSRGVANVAAITKAIVDFLKEKQAKPFVFPAMGSHGGATAEGQLEILEGFGITEENMGCPIKASMETVQIGVRDDGEAVRIDKIASEADGIIICGRIKAHTSFRGPIESGLVKMAVIGLGKQHGAETVHALGFPGMDQRLIHVGHIICDNCKILFGLGTIENAYDQTYKVAALTPDEIFEKEPELLLEAKSKMGKLMFKNADLLVVDRIGKDVSGDGMDPNVTNRYACLPSTPDNICIQRIVALSLTKDTHHNANGVGMADITTRRLAADTILDITYPNAVTSTVVDVVKMPLIVESDKIAIQLGLRICNGIDRANPKVIRILDTMHLDEIYISEALREEAEQCEDIEIIGEPEEWKFNSEGNLW
ncbi:MAG: lactate racemase domain-containing protein [Christensenellales bacterium]|jgi:hypothetical protein